MYKENRKQGLINQVKYRKISNNRKWTDREHHVQDNANFAHKYLKIYCDTNQLPLLKFCASHPKPRGARGLGKHHHLLFGQNLCHGICAIYRIPCACVACTSMLDKPWTYGIQSTKQAH